MSKPKSWQYAAVLALLAAAISRLIIFRSPIPQVNRLAALSVGVMAFCITLTVKGGHLGPITSQYNLAKIGLVTRTGEIPFLIRKRPDANVPNGMLLDFETRGIPREVFEDKREYIESALNIFIYKIVDGKDRRHITIYAVPASDGLSDKELWKPSYLSRKDFVLVVGRSLTGPAKVDLAKTPHILLGGSTGSGKTIALKLLLLQCVQKGADVYIADFKGGLDFGGYWEDSCTMLYDENALFMVLQALVAEMRERKAALKAAGYPNIHELNKEHPNSMQRLILACDEVAEALDKTGRTKEDKELIDQITACLVSIARIGRALGVHLILATQRPDANIIPGQLKNNLDYRICGRADMVLSQIVLDSSDAADQIPKDARGRFLTNDGTLIQGYWFDERTLNRR